jgi:hypothetical protein
MSTVCRAFTQSNGDPASSGILLGVTHEHAPEGAAPDPSCGAWTAACAANSLEHGAGPAREALRLTELTRWPTAGRGRLAPYLITQLNQGVAPNPKRGHRRKPQRR